MNKEVAKKVLLFFEKYKLQKYRKGEILVRADENPTGIFYLTKGSVKMYAISQKGEELTINIFKEGAFFPMSWALNNSFNPYYFEAVSDVELKKATKESVLEFLKNEPDVVMDLLARVYKGVDGMMQRMSYLMGGSAYHRLIVEIIIQSKRFGKRKGTSMVLKISEKDLASMTGMTRETISRELKVLKDKGLVVLSGGFIEIKELEQLEAEIENGV